LQPPQTEANMSSSCEEPNPSTQQSPAHETGEGLANDKKLKDKNKALQFSMIGRILDLILLFHEIN